MISNKLKTLALLAAPTALALAANPVAANENVPTTYTIKSGDTLAKISEDIFGSVEYVEEIAYINGINDINLIYADEVLNLEGVTELDLSAVVVYDATDYVEPTYYDASAEYTYDYSYDPGYTYNYNYSAPAVDYSGYTSGVQLSNGNTAGETGAYAAAQMEARTGVPASTWEYIIARESNGQVTAYNPSGASGLFQTMPGWGSTATVEDQINAATNAYNAQGLSAWGM